MVDFWHFYIFSYVSKYDNVDIFSWIYVQIEIIWDSSHWWLLWIFHIFTRQSIFERIRLQTCEQLLLHEQLLTQIIHLFNNLLWNININSFSKSLNWVQSQSFGAKKYASILFFENWTYFSICSFSSLIYNVTEDVHNSDCMSLWIKIFLYFSQIQLIHFG